MMFPYLCRIQPCADAMAQGGEGYGTQEQVVTFGHQPCVAGRYGEHKGELRRLLRATSGEKGDRSECVEDELKQPSNPGEANR